jgi:hypothetical protein
MKKHRENNRLTRTKLSLRRQTLRVLNVSDLQIVAGGDGIDPNKGCGFLGTETATQNCEETN